MDVGSIGGVLACSNAGFCNSQQPFDRRDKLLRTTINNFITEFVERSTSVQRVLQQAPYSGGVIHIYQHVRGF
jgi:hypothetical protein